MDLLQRSWSPPWPELELDDEVSWAPPSAPAAPVVVTAAPEAPVPWSVAPTTTLVREIQKLLPTTAAGGQDGYPFAPAPVGTYSPFRRK